jgi:hypothetical protein
MGTTMTIGNTFRSAFLIGLGGALALVTACGGGDDGGDDTGVDDDLGEPIPEELLLDDLDDGDGAIHEVGGRIGSWFSYNDGTATTQVPGPNGDFIPAEGGAQDSAYYARTQGDSFTEWGAGFGFDINNTGVDGPAGEGEKKPYDASAYQGIRFLAKGNVPVRVGILVSAVVEDTYGGGCTPPAEPTEGEDCGDAHGKDLSLTGEWKEYRVPFEGLKQGDWGKPADFDAATITSIHFDIAQGLTFDVGIDRLGFY